MPLDALVTGRIATLAGDDGFGWVEAVGIRAGRIAFAGTEVDLETRADPFTERITLEPDEVAVPGLTDAHLHLAEYALASRAVDLGDASTIEDGMTALRLAAERVPDPDAWILGRGWSVDRWGRWPTAADVERALPGRLVLAWSHDRHGVLASGAALRRAGIDASTPDPDGGVIRRAADGRAPDGVLLEGAVSLVTRLVPRPTVAELAAAIALTSDALLRLGLVACHDPGLFGADPDLELAFGAYAALADAGRLPLRVHTSLRADALGTAIAGRLTSGLVLGSDPAGRARIGWLKLFADGSLGSRTAALLEPYDDAPDELALGVWNMPPDEMRDLARRAARAGITTQIHAIGDAAVRAALDVLAGLPSVAQRGATMPVPMPRVEHAQMVHPDDVDRFARHGIAASVQPVHLAADAEAAHRAWGQRAEIEGYPWESIARSGAVIAFGTDAPVESPDPWPGLALAVTRQDPTWPAGSSPFGPDQAVSLARALRGACLDPALSAGETDRGRLVPGQRADLIVLPASAFDEPVEPGGPLATARPRLVMVDGEVVVEA